MCVTFFYQNEECEPNGYRLVLANNRDERWSRPTKLAQFWGSRQDCISGLDMSTGKEGGTWLGMNKSGKVAVLLNVPGQGSPFKRGRGFLVSDYLVQDYDIDSYAEKVCSERENYSGFNLLLFDIRNEEAFKPIYLTNARNYNLSSNAAFLEQNKSYGLSNSPIDYPFLKAARGRQRFDTIVRNHRDTHSKHWLVEDLMEMMADKSPYTHDKELNRVMKAAKLDPAYTIHRSALNVWSPGETYGTRTTTLILVDGEGTVNYIERTVNNFYSDPSQTTLCKTFELTED